MKRRSFLDGLAGGPQSDDPFLPNYEPRPIYLGEGITWTPSVRTAKALAMQRSRSFVGGFVRYPLSNGPRRLRELQERPR